MKYKILSLFLILSVFSTASAIDFSEFEEYAGNSFVGMEYDFEKHIKTFWWSCSINNHLPNDYIDSVFRDITDLRTELLSLKSNLEDSRKKEDELRDELRIEENKEKNSVSAKERLYAKIEAENDEQDKLHIKIREIEDEIEEIMESWEMEDLEMYFSEQCRNVRAAYIMKNKEKNERLLQKLELIIQKEYNKNHQTVIWIVSYISTIEEDVMKDDFDRYILLMELKRIAEDIIK